jgi:hypothetical protein
MKKLIMTFAVLFSLGTAMTTFTSCRDTNKSDVEKAADDVGDAVEDAADDVEDAIN